MSYPFQVTRPQLENIAGIKFAFSGWIGRRMHANEANWLKTAPATNPGMLEMFEHRANLHFVNGALPAGDPVPWAGEFAGKYLHSATQSLWLTGNAELESVAGSFVSALVATQGADGSLGMPLAWDLWGQYHVMLALLRWHERTSDERALNACLRAADLMCARYLGRASAIAQDHPGDDEKNQSIAHVLALLYEKTGKVAYLDLVREIEVEWTKPPCGNFINNALAGREFFSGSRPRWEGLHCVQAIGELHYATGTAYYRSALIQIWRSIRDWDRHVNGGFTCFEAATGDKFDPRYIETCGTVAWMALSIDILRMSGEVEAADELELSFYNAILGSQSPDGRFWTYHIPMGGIPIGSLPQAAFLGYRLPAFYDLAWQARDRYPQLSCCAANGPRGIGCLSEWAVMLESDVIVVNYYGAYTSVVPLNDGHDSLTISQVTEYPFDGHISIAITPSRAGLYQRLRFRIPSWSTVTSFKINGDFENCTPGTYRQIGKKWYAGDTVELFFDMRVRLVRGSNRAEGLAAALRGPILLVLESGSGFDPLSPPVLSQSPPPSVSMFAGASLAATFSSSGGEVVLRDFASSSQALPGQLFGRPAPEGLWQFSRSDGTVLAERIRLRKDGKIDGYSYPNEARWGYEGDSIAFYSKDGAASTRFTLRALQNGKKVLMGFSVFDKSIRHILSEVDLDVTGKFWQFRRIHSGSPSVLVPAFRLLSGGKFSVPMHPNERAWAMQGDDLVFLDGNGAITTRFSSVRMRYGRTKFGGTFALDSSITHELWEVDADVSSLTWRFISRKPSRPDVLFSDKVRLLKDGRVDGYSHPNEARWVRGSTADNLAFLSISGVVTTQFSRFYAHEGVMRFEGSPAFDASTTHILEELAPGWRIDDVYVSWLSWVDIFTQGTGVTSRAPNHMDLFWVHPDGSTRSTWWDSNDGNGLWDAGRPFAVTHPSEAAAGPVAVVARAPNHMDLFWVHPDGSIRSTWWDSNDGNGLWDAGRPFAVTHPGEAAAGPVAVVARAPNHMDLFWVHPDGSIRSTWWDSNDGNGLWDAGRPFAVTHPGEAAAGPVAVVARAPNHMDLFWVHPDGSIRSTWWDSNDGNGLWDAGRPFAVTHPGEAAAGPVAVVARAPNHMDLFWVHPDGSIRSTWWDSNDGNGLWDAGRPFAVTHPGEAAAGPVAVVARAPNHMDLFWVHPDGSIRSTWWDSNDGNGLWDAGRPFAVTHPGEAAAGPVAVVARAPNHMDLFWVHPDGSIRSTWWDSNDGNGLWDAGRPFAVTHPGEALSL